MIRQFNCGSGSACAAFGKKAEITMKEQIPMSAPDITEEDVQAVAEVVRSGRLALGPKTEEFEARIAEYVGVKYAVAVSSGTAALHLIVRALGIGPGTVIFAGVVVNTGSIIGAGVILNTGSTVDHHNHIHDFAHIAPGAHLAGEVVVDEGVLVGVGAAVIPGKHIGEWAVVGAGAVVVQDIPPRVTVVGVPAKPLSRKG